MGYTKQNFKDFDKPLTAAQLEKMEGGILEAIQTAENANGEDGVTPHIGTNGNWYIGAEDTGKPSRGEAGEDGEDGVTPHIGTNGNWYIGAEDTGKPSRGEPGEDGEDGVTPHIGTNGNWYIGAEDTGKPSRGEPGPKGTDGTGVTILGSFESESALQAAHPTGNIGDAYLVSGNLYVWSASDRAWINVGNIQGPPGEQGPPGDAGKTPIKGEDYFTDADKREMVNDVLAALPIYAGEVESI